MWIEGKAMDRLYHWFIAASGGIFLPTLSVLPSCIINITNRATYIHMYAKQSIVTVSKPLSINIYLYIYIGIYIYKETTHISVVDEQLTASMSPSNLGIKPRAWGLVRLIDDDSSISFQGPLEDWEVQLAASIPFAVCNPPSESKEGSDEHGRYSSFIFTLQAIFLWLFHHVANMATSLYITMCMQQHSMISNNFKTIMHFIAWIHLGWWNIYKWSQMSEWQSV